MTCTTSSARKTKQTRPRVGRSKPGSLSTLEAEQEEHYHNSQVARTIKHRGGGGTTRTDGQEQELESWFSDWSTCCTGVEPKLVAQHSGKKVVVAAQMFIPPSLQRVETGGCWGLLATSPGPSSVETLFQKKENKKAGRIEQDTQCLLLTSTLVGACIPTHTCVHVHTHQKEDINKNRKNIVHKAIVLLINKLNEVLEKSLKQKKK